MASDWRTVIAGVTEGIPLAVSVVFVNDVLGRKVERTVQVGNPSLASICAALRAERDDLTANADVVPKLPAVGQVLDIDIPPPAPRDPTPEELADRQFFLDMFRLRSMRAAVAYGLSDKDIDVAAQLEIVQQQFNARFLSDPRFF